MRIKWELREKKQTGVKWEERGKEKRDRKLFDSFDYKEFIEVQ